MLETIPTWADSLRRDDLFYNALFPHRTKTLPACEKLQANFNHSDFYKDFLNCN